MKKKANLEQYKQELLIYFNQRNNYDAEGDFHPQLAHRFIEYTNIQPGAKVLDVATGTGLVAIEAAQLVGADGYVLGVDISPVMLDQAKRKVENLGLNNIEFWQADAEVIELSDNSFDLILCCSALVYLSNIPAALRHWQRFLKPGGLIGFTGFSEDSFINSHVLQEVVEKYQINFPKWNEPTGTEEKCYSLLAEAEFENIDIKIEQLGSYISFSQATAVWRSSFKNPLSRPLLELSEAELEQAKADYKQKMAALVTPKGIWNEILTFFVFGRKPIAQ